MTLRPTPPRRSSLPAALLTFAAAGLAAPPTAEAQTPGREPAVVELPASARALALGGAYPLADPEADVLFHNPSLLEEAGASILGGVDLMDDASLGFTVAASREWFGGGVGVGLRVLEYDSPGPGLRSGGLDPLTSGREGAVDGATGVTEIAASLGVSREFLGVQAGVAAKVVAQRWPDFRQASASFDVGVARRIGLLTVGLAVRNLGPDRSLGAPEDEVPQPTTVTLGTDLRSRPLGPLDVAPTAAVTRRDDGEWLVGGGLAVAYWPVVGRTFTARIGATTVPEGDASPLSAGFSYRGDEVVLRWAWRPVGEDGDVHRFSVGWR